jgi:hypothetical protein
MKGLSLLGGGRGWVVISPFEPLLSSITTVYED